MEEVVKGEFHELLTFVISNLNSTFQMMFTDR